MQPEDHQVLQSDQTSDASPRLAACHTDDAFLSVAVAASPENSALAVFALGAHPLTSSRSGNARLALPNGNCFPCCTLHEPEHGRGSKVRTIERQEQFKFQGFNNNE